MKRIFGLRNPLWLLSHAFFALSCIFLRYCACFFMLNSLDIPWRANRNPYQVMSQMTCCSPDDARTCVLCLVTVSFIILLYFPGLFYMFAALLLRILCVLIFSSDLWYFRMLLCIFYPFLLRVFLLLQLCIVLGFFICNW